MSSDRNRRNSITARLLHRLWIESFLRGNAPAASRNKGIASGLCIGGTSLNTSCSKSSSRSPPPLTDARRSFAPCGSPAMIWEGGLLGAPSPGHPATAPPKSQSASASSPRLFLQSLSFSPSPCGRRRASPSAPPAGPAPAPAYASITSPPAHRAPPGARRQPAPRRRDVDHDDAQRVALRPQPFRHRHNRSRLHPIGPTPFSHPRPHFPKSVTRPAQDAKQPARVSGLAGAGCRRLEPQP